jgi:CRISPR-associated protein Cas1
MFQIRNRDENREVQKKRFWAQKVTALRLCTALSTDAIKLSMTHNVDIVFLE